MKKVLIVHFEHREDQAFQEREQSDYDQALGVMIDEIRMLPHADEQASVLSSLALSVFRREGALSSDGLSRFAELFLDLASKAFDPENRLTLMLLFLRVWNMLASMVRNSPPSAPMNSDLPEGVCLPSGADPDQIDDKNLREQDHVLAAQHRLQVDRWNDGQQAQAHLTDLAGLSVTAFSSLFDTLEARQAFLAVMKQAEGLPDSAFAPA